MWLNYRHIIRFTVKNAFFSLTFAFKNPFTSLTLLWIAYQRVHLCFWPCLKVNPGMCDTTICSTDVQIGTAREASKWNFWMNLDLPKALTVFPLKYLPICQRVIDQFWWDFLASSERQIHFHCVWTWHTGQWLSIPEKEKYWYQTLLVAQTYIWLEINSSCKKKVKKFRLEKTQLQEPKLWTRENIQMFPLTSGRRMRS